MSVARAISITLAMAGAIAPVMAACEDLLPGPAEATAPPRDVTANDLARLRDIGQPTDRSDGESPIGLSADRTRIAFVLRKADPATNSYCQGLVVLDLAGLALPRLVDTGGALIRDRFPLSGTWMPESGVPKAIVPRWGPDDRQIAYLKRLGDHARVWLVDSVTGQSRPLGPETFPIESFVWSEDGRSIIAASSIALTEAETRTASGGAAGHLVDERFRPLTARKPLPLARDISPTYLHIDIATGATRPATDAERARLEELTLSPGAPLASKHRSGGIVRATMSAASPLERRLTVTRNGKEQSCAACTGDIQSVWWRDSDTILFLTREGEARQFLALYSWTPDRDAAPTRINRSSDLILNCQPQEQARAICLAERGLSPRRLEFLDGHTGKRTPYWDPNPGFARLRKARVERLSWTSATGASTFGDLVLPPEGKGPFPLVIVQYGSRGFLRGGTGDEFPILALAARGHAVLSFQRPLHLAFASKGGAPAGDRSQLAERRHVQAALDAGIDLAIARGMVRPDRIAITGLSDGATTVQWALLHNPRYRAATMSSCCLDPGLMAMLGEIQIKAWSASGGYPRPGDFDAPFWKEASLSMNAARLDTPILMQLADDEFLGALEGFRSLQTAGKPVEMHVFDDERHIKYQPAHRLAIYERNIQWLDFWLRDTEDAALGLAGQYARWRAMRDRTPLTR